MTLTCPTCGERFESAKTHINRSKTPKDAFCSDECWYKDYAETHLTPGKIPPRKRDGDGTGWALKQDHKGD